MLTKKQSIIITAAHPLPFQGFQSPPSRQIPEKDAINDPVADDPISSRDDRCIHRSGAAVGRRRPHRDWIRKMHVI